MDSLSLLCSHAFQVLQVFSGLFATKLRAKTQQKAKGKKLIMNVAGPRPRKCILRSFWTEKASSCCFESLSRHQYGMYMIKCNRPSPSIQFVDCARLCHL